MVHQKNVAIKRTPKTTMIYGNQAWKKAKKSPNMRTGGYIGMELKFLDNTHESVLNTGFLTAVRDPATALCMNAVPLGSGESSRQGRKIWMESLEINGYIQLTTPLTAAQMGGMVTIWIVKDKQTNEAQMVATDAINPDAGFTSGNVNSFPNLQWKERFEILSKKRLVINAQAGYGSVEARGAGDLIVPFAFKLPLNCNTTFDTEGDGGTVETITDNSLHVIAISTEPTAHVMSYQSRLRFVDT